jgi:predicted nucleic acid-binding protein
MPAERFFNTNVLIYAFAAAGSRSARAEALLAEGGVIGVQVLNEFTSVMRRKLACEWRDIEAALGVIEELLGRARPLTAAVHEQAVALARDHALAFFDALIVAAAADAGCRELCSEGLQHGRPFGLVIVRNPCLTFAIMYFTNPRT